jgi:hypothetical protein
MNNIKIPLIAGIIIFFLVLLINIFSGNSFSVIIMRSFLSLVISFGLIYGAIFVLTDVLKIDFNVTEQEGYDKEPENKVNIMVDDMDVTDMKNETSFESDDDLHPNDISNESEINENDSFISKNDDMKTNDEYMNEDQDSDKGQNSSGMSDLGDVDFGNRGTSFDDTQETYDQTGQNENIDQTEQIERKDTDSYSNSSSVKDKLGMNATTEDLVKAIRTKISKDG